MNIVEDATSESVVVLILGIVIIIVAKERLLREGLLREGAGLGLIFVGEGAERAVALAGLEYVGIWLVLAEKSFALILSLVLEDIASLA